MPTAKKTAKKATRKKAAKKTKPAASAKIDQSILMRKFTNYGHDLKTNMAALTDRMMRHMQRPRECPECGATPVVCMMRRPGYAAYRCRVCNFRWEAETENRG